nr:retrovirus-related Pol polyprotein from transposon TNT 1-94 [Tanacetum cinerariifolium]
MRRVGKGFSRVDTPLFASMLVPQQAQDVEDVAEDTCATLTKQVANLEQDKVAQAIEITKLKKRVRRGGIVKLDADEDVTLEEVDAIKDAKVQGRLEESQAKVYHLDLEHADKVLSMQETNEAEPADVEEVLEVVIAAKLMTEVVTTATTPITAAPVPKASALRRRGVIIQDPKEAATASLSVQSEVKSKDKGKGILVEKTKPLKRQVQIEQDEAFSRELEVKLNANINWNEVISQVKKKERQDNTVMRYQALKRKSVTEAHARKNMMVYLKNMAGFKMDFFKGMTFTDIRPFFKKHFNSIWAFLEKGEKEIEEEESKRKSNNLKQKVAKKQNINEETEDLKIHLQIVPNDEDDVYTEATPLALKVLVIDYQIHIKHNKPYYKIIRAAGTHQLFLSFFTLLRNFDREDLEMLWKIVQERFKSSEPKNFSYDFLLNALKTIKYPLTRFTLEQMLNNIRLEVKEESEMSLELLNLLVEIIIFVIDSGCSKHMTGNLKLLINFVEKFLGLNHNLFSVGQFYDANLEVAFRKSTCYIRDLKGNDLLICSRATDLYSVTLQDTSSPNPICLMAKVTSSQAWLWHRRLSHLNFDTINLLSKNDIVIGLPKLVERGLHAQVRIVRTEKGTEFLNKTPHTYFATKGIEHQTSVARTPEQNGIVERRSRTLIEAARTMLSAAKVPLSKDETPEVLIDFHRLVQRGLQAQVRVVRTDKGSEFLNQTLHAYFAAEGILHKMSIAQTPEQNGVVERRNRTLVEAARTMLSAAKVPLFFCAEAIATACFTQNRSLVIPHHEKTSYHIINDRKPSVKFFHIFGSICYIVRDGENLDKLKEKCDECIFVGYSTKSRAYRVFNKRTRVIMESIHVNFDELPQMASDQLSSDPAHECQTMALNHDSLSLTIQRQTNVPQADRTVTTSKELDLLFYNTPCFRVIDVVNKFTMYLL